MRSKLGLAFLVAASAIAAGVLPATTASGQTVLRVVFGPAAEVRAAAVDVGKNGLRLGDRIAARGPLVDESQSERLGNGYAHCIVHRRILDPNIGLWNCDYVLELSEGDIMLKGLDPRGPGSYEMAVLGGTGAYAGADGDATFTDAGPDGSAYTDMVIRLED